MKPRIWWNGKQWFCYLPGEGMMREGKASTIRGAYEDWTIRKEFWDKLKGK